MKVVKTPFSVWNARFSPANQEINKKHITKINQGAVKLSHFKRNGFFVKIETTWKRFLPYILAAAWIPRCIISASVYVRVLLGPWFHAMAGILKKNWSVTRDALAFACGYTSVQVGEWLRHQSNTIIDPEYFEIDYSRWDSSICVEMLKLLEKIYRYFGMHGRELLVYKQQYKLFAESKQGVSFSRTGMVETGVPNTTVGNSILNGLITWFLFTEAGGVLGRSFSAMVLGDDMIAVVSKGLAPNFVEQAKKLGLSPKLKRGHQLASVSFCSNAFYPAILRGLYRWCAAPTLKAMLKISWTTSLIDPSLWWAHARGVALGLLTLVNHIPIFVAYLEKILSFSQTHTPKSQRIEDNARVQREMHTFPPTKCDPHPEILPFLSQRYGIGMQVFLDMIQEFAKFTTCMILDTPLIRYFTVAIALVECA